MKYLVGPLVASALLTLSAHAQTTTIFASSADTANFDNSFSGDATTYGAAVVDGSSTIGSGDALRVWDLDSSSKGEAVFNTSSALTGGFRLSFDVYNQSVSGNGAIRLRFANAGLSVGTEGNTATSISWEPDGDLTYKFDDGGSGRTTVTAINSTNSAYAVDLVFNASISESLTYFLNDGLEQTLSALSYDLWIDGAKIGAGNYAFTTGASTGFDATEGIGVIGWLGSSNSNSGSDIVLDNIVLALGAAISTSAIPEPTSFALLFGLVAVGCVGTRRRRA